MSWPAAMVEGAPANYVRSNELRLATSGDLEINCTGGGTITPSPDDLKLAISLTLTGSPSAAFTVRLPDGTRIYLIHNATTRTATIDTTTGASDPAALEPGNAALVRFKGTQIPFSLFTTTDYVIPDSAAWVSQQQVPPRRARMPVIPGGAIIDPVALTLP